MKNHDCNAAADSLCVSSPAGDMLTDERYTYQTLLDQMPVGVILTDRSGAIVYANDCAAAMSGYSVEELRQGTWLCHSANITARDLYNRALSRDVEGTDHVIQLAKKDGTLLWVSLSWRALPNTGSTDLIQLVLTDITARKLAEEALRESEAKYKCIVENSHDMIMINRPDAVVSYISPSCSEILGYSQEELMGAVPMVVHPDDRKHAAALFGKALSGKSGTNVEYRVVTKSGEIRWTSHSWSAVCSDGKLQMIVSACKDITERKISEAAIRDAEEKYRLLAENASDMIWQVDTAGVITYVSQAICRYGYEQSDWIGHPLTEFLAPHERQPFLERLENDKTELVSKNYEVEMLRKDGATVWTEISVSFVVQNGVLSTIQGISRDISERKHAEEALRESENRYRGLVESQEDLIVRVDTEGRFTFVNEAYCRMFGKPADELIGSSFVPLVHEDDLPGTLAAMEQLNSPPYRCRVEQRAFTIDGWRWLSWEDCAILDENGSVTEIQAIGRDITESKAAHESLQCSEARLRALVSNIPGAVYRTRLDRNWPMEFLSEAIEDISGYSAEDFIGSQARTYASIIHPDDAARVWKVIENSVRQKHRYEIEYRLLHADGSIRWVLEKGQAVFSDNDELLSLDGIIFDITDRKNSEEELRKAYDIQREFLNNITHEVRTPLTAVQGYVQMLMEGMVGPVSDEQAGLLKRVLVSSDHLLSIVTGVLEIARTKSGTMQLQPKICTPCLIVEKAVSAIATQAAKKDLYVNVELPDQKQFGTYDEQKLTIILTNLLTNAVKFTENGGIDIKVSCDRRGTEIIVADTGMGIGQDGLASIFDEFTQLDYPKKHKPTGFGIGLAIVAAMIETIKGTLTVSSSPGIGTAFMIYAPTLEETP